MSKTIKILCIATVLLPNTANAATYTLPSTFILGYASDYRHFYSPIDTRTFGCSDATIEDATYPDDFYALSTGETIQHSGDLYYCCADNGYWVMFENQSSVPNGDCPTKYNWVSLGSNKYCQATMTPTMDWCYWPTSAASGVESSNNVGQCVYSNGTCSTFTHCAKGHYKNGSSCIACPNGGTTSGYTNGGISDCYLTPGTTGTDSTGNWEIVGGNCDYKQQ